MENVTLTLHFLLPLFDTPTWHVLSYVAVKEKKQLFLAYVVYLCLFARVIFVICLLKMQGNLRGKAEHTRVSGV